jgi:thiol-disulfide isomerase/thioredoxin
MSDLETSNSSGSDAKEKEVVYKQMQMAAGASLLVFGVGLAAFSYFYNQSNVSSYHQYSRSEDVKKWPSSAPARPQANGLTLMSFWAYWCEPCREEMPDMSKLADSVESLHIVFLNTDEPDNPNWDEAHQFADRFDNASVEYSLGQSHETHEQFWSLYAPGSLFGNALWASGLAYGGPV